jgi:monofunctional biosynthetic peptidoglycan transglycosylase
LNEIEWGDGIYGAEAAARAYFGTSAAAVGPDQAALMAGAIVNPRLLDIAHPNARLRARQRIIRSRMGNITPPPVIITPVDHDVAPNPDMLPEAPPETFGEPPADQSGPDSSGAPPSGPSPEPSSDAPPSQP